MSSNQNPAVNASTAKPIRRALLSVTDKTGLVEFAQVLAGFGAELISTGGPAHVLHEAGLPPGVFNLVTGYGPAVGEALAGGGREALALYDERLAHAYADYYKVANAFVRLISNPQAVQLCVGVGMRSEWLMTQLLRIMSNLMRPDALGPAEVGYRAMEAVAHLLPDTLSARLSA